jgi:hypothetical protein
MARIRLLIENFGKKLVVEDRRINRSGCCLFSKRPVFNQKLTPELLITRFLYGNY